MNRILWWDSAVNYVLPTCIVEIMHIRRRRIWKWIIQNDFISSKGIYIWDLLVKELYINVVDSRRTVGLWNWSIHLINNRWYSLKTCFLLIASTIVFLNSASKPYLITMEAYWNWTIDLLWYLSRWTNLRNDTRDLIFILSTLGHCFL